MVPREASRGTSFKGAGLYYLHDRNAETAERVAFTHTENVPTKDPEKALKWMAWTAMHAEDLKSRNGEETRGRKSEKPVYSFSLSWHPEEDPDKVTMIVAARQALEKLGLRDHETLMVGHSDREHKHLHCIVSAVHPETGKSNTFKNSRKKLSQWAQAYEEERGHVYCEQRVANNQKRAEGRDVKFQERPLDIKGEITRAYFKADSGHAFKAALEEKGLRLAKADRLVIVDQHGNLHGLYKHIDGAKSKDIKAKLRDLDIPHFDEAREGTKGKDGRSQKIKPTRHEDYDDRDEAERLWQERTISSGIASEKALVATGLKNRTQDRHLDEWGVFYSASLRARQEIEYIQDNQYGESERQLRRDITEIEGALEGKGRVGVWWMKITGRVGLHAERDLETMRKTLGNIEQRKAEQQGALETRLAAERAAIEERHAQERGRAPEARPDLLKPEQVDELARSIDNREDSYEARRAAFLAQADGAAEGESSDDDAFDPLSPTDPLAVSIRQQQFAQAAAQRHEAPAPNAPITNIPVAPVAGDIAAEERRAQFFTAETHDRDRGLDRTPER